MTGVIFLMIVWTVIGMAQAILETDWWLFGSALASALLLAWCAQPAWRLARQGSK